MKKTAKEVIESLYNIYEPNDLTYDDIATVYQHDHGPLTPEAYVKLYEQRLNEEIDELLPIVCALEKGRLGDLGSRISRRFLFNSSLVNASARLAPERTYEVTLNMGLSHFINTVVRTIATRLGVMAVDGRREISPRQPASVANIHFRELVAAFWSGRMLDLKSIEFGALQRHQLIFVGQFQRSISHFIVGHELGHVMMWEAGADSNARKLGRFLVEKLLKQISFLSEIADLNLWAEEFAADYLGFMAMMGAEKDDVSRLSAWSSAETLLAVLQCMGDVYQRQNKEEISLQTHPPPGTRLSALRAYLALHNPPHCFEMGKQIEFIVQDIFARMPA